MLIFTYDKSFDGLLSAVFEAYSRKQFPDMLLEEGASLPLFYNEIISIVSDSEKSGRVWKGLKKKLDETALKQLMACWLSELPEADMLLFRYIRKAIDNQRSIELDFGDPDVLEVVKISRRVEHERLRLLQFIRFQKTGDDTYFAPMEPQFNVLPLAIDHFRDRFSDQKWLIYDLKRKYGYYYDLHEVTEVTFPDLENHHITGKLNEALLAEDEKVFQKLWKTYFKAIAIKERINPRLHKHNMPVRYWKHLTEKQ